MIDYRSDEKNLDTNEVKEFHRYLKKDYDLNFFVGAQIELNTDSNHVEYFCITISFTGTEEFCLYMDSANEAFDVYNNMMKAIKKEKLPREMKQSWDANIAFPLTVEGMANQLDRAVKAVEDKPPREPGMFYPE
jgi:hypothetical protein